MFPKSYKKIVYYTLYVVYILLLIEISARVFLTINKGVPFFNPKEIIYNFYPQLKKVKQTHIMKGDEWFDMLLLGGSVIDINWGTIGQLFHEKLAGKIKRRVRIHNVAWAAHTSLDSYYKYKHLLDKDFDLVVLYHGVNEIRANNCPPSFFKSDYSHYSWYESVNIFEKHKEINSIAFPYVFHDIFLKIRTMLNPSRHLRTHWPIPEWIRYGCNIKTAHSFKNNLINILEIAHKKKETTLLMTFSIYIPKNYSREKFKNKHLDYGTHKIPVEMLGKPENVAKGIVVHNEVIKEVAARYENILFVDQSRLMPKNGSHFDDFCHLTNKGCEKFVDNILEVIDEFLKSQNTPLP